MKKLLVYAVVLAAGIILLKLAEYKFLIINHSLEFYGGIIALVFTVTGIWAGRKLSAQREKIIEKTVVVKEEVIVEKEVLRDAQQPDATQPLADAEAFGISSRELEVLNLMAQGMSNQEIADKLFISLSTVKTHSSNLFVKLEAKRRTEAVVKARELRLIG